ncbi:hypothetical protein J1D01_10675 [Seonamhaeicola sp. NFXS20]|uniref:hypothetical protein n=1 Tax=Seonamhaeicola sp. NFXS20 TaxID=2816959 RepID=UPI003B8DDB1D
MPISQAQLADKIEAALKYNSDDPEVDIPQARKHFANELAEAIAQFTIGRETTVTGTSATGGAVTGTGIIKGTP